ncbi:MAG: hypothetical protein Kow002_03770 [Anaerolineales bacterium]
MQFDDNDTLQDYKVDVNALIDADDGVKAWVLEYGEGAEPNQWVHLADGKSEVPDMTRLAVWDLENIQRNSVVLRIYVEGKNGYAERKIALRVDLPTPTPSPTLIPTSTHTPVPTGTPLPTLTPTLLPTNTPVPSAMPTSTFTPFLTPTFTPTRTFTPIPTFTPVP